MAVNMGLARSRSAAVAVLLIIACSAAYTRAQTQPEDISPIIEAVIAKTKLQGQAATAAVVRVDAKGTATTIALGAAGQRMKGDETPALPNDVFMVASCGKSFTASLFGVLVTQKLVTWTTKIGTILTDLGHVVPDARQQFLDATVGQLLHHRAGFDSDTEFDGAPPELFQALQPGAAITATEQRRLYSYYVLTQKPANALNKFLYSNIGYEFAGWLAEAITGESYEALITKYFYQPLGMVNATFALAYQFPLVKPPAQPVGHQCSDTTGLKPTANYWQSYATYGFGSGGLSMTINDLATWVGWHMQGLLGFLPETSPIDQAAFQRLHKPWASPGARNDGNYALGWVNDTDPYDSMSHDGAFAGFRTNMIGVMTPDEEGNMLAVAVTTNMEEGKSSSGKCSNAVDNILNGLSTSLIAKFSPGVVEERRRGRRLSRAGLIRLN